MPVVIFTTTLYPQRLVSWWVQNSVKIILRRFNNEYSNSIWIRKTWDIIITYSDRVWTKCYHTNSYSVKLMKKKPSNPTIFCKQNDKFKRVQHNGDSVISTFMVIRQNSARPPTQYSVLNKPLTLYYNRERREGVGLSTSYLFRIQSVYESWSIKCWARTHSLCVFRLPV